MGGHFWISYILGTSTLAAGTSNPLNIYDSSLNVVEPFPATSTTYFLVVNYTGILANVHTNTATVALTFIDVTNSTTETISLGSTNNFLNDTDSNLHSVLGFSGFADIFNPGHVYNATFDVGAATASTYFGGNVQITISPLRDVPTFP